MVKILIVCEQFKFFRKLLHWPFYTQFKTNTNDVNRVVDRKM